MKATVTKQIKIHLQQQAAQVLSHAKHAASKNGIKLIGNESSGHFAGQGIEGHYHIEDGVVLVSIKRKPMLVPWSMLEARLIEFFSTQKA